VQVKTSGKRANGFPMPDAQHVRAGRHDWYVLVRWLKREQRWECFLLTGRVARAQVERTTSRKVAVRGDGALIIHSVDVGPGTDAKNWNRAWEQWNL
jgi:hypothetical protein